MPPWCVVSGNICSGNVCAHASHHHGHSTPYHHEWGGRELRFRKIIVDNNLKDDICNSSILCLEKEKKHKAQIVQRRPK